MISISLLTNCMLTVIEARIELVIIKIVNLIYVTVNKIRNKISILLIFICVNFLDNHNKTLIYIIFVFNYNINYIFYDYIFFCFVTFIKFFINPFKYNN